VGIFDALFAKNWLSGGKAFLFLSINKENLVLFLGGYIRSSISVASLA
jgi:hypothetical protein